MIYKTCKCGKSQSWSSGMRYYDCQGCSECGTTFGTTVMKNGNPVTEYRPLQEHDYSIVKYNTNTGKPYTMCKWCHHIEESSFKQSRIPNE